MEEKEEEEEEEFRRRNLPNSFGVHANEVHTSKQFEESMRQFLSTMISLREWKQTHDVRMYLIEEEEVIQFQ